MAQTLLPKKLQKKLHTALFMLCALFGFQAKAQTVLLPGDVVIVSVNADSQSFDFIPLIDIEKGTSIYFSNGKWNRTDATLDGNELKITFNTQVIAGSNIHFSNDEDSRFSKNGTLIFKGDTHRLFVFQKEETIHRFLFAMGWGKGNPWKTKDQLGKGSDIPLSLVETPDALLSLGEEPNQQYYLRNGASGTRNMLLAFVGEPENWRGIDGSSFDVFGTSFNLLTPPVVQFNKIFSVINEEDSAAVLNLSIYEHDGSRLSVDVEFDTLRSIASKPDLKGFTSHTINFTGLVGDYSYAVKIPILDDEIYEGRESGILTLNNLSKGSYGDFLTHNLLIEDNEQPEVVISRIANGTEVSGFIEIQNHEEREVSMEGWVLSGNKQSYKFPKEALLSPNETVKWIDADVPDSELNMEAANVFISGLKGKKMLRNDGGVLTLQDFTGKIVHQISYSKVYNTDDKEVKRTNLAMRKPDENLQSGNLTNRGEQSVATTVPENSGWEVLSRVNNISTDFTEKTWYSWNEELQTFQAISDVSMQTVPVLGFFEKEETELLSSYMSGPKNKSLSSEELRFTVSATDKNGNNTIDGIEGLNFVYNDLDRSISVASFIEQIKNEYPDLIVSDAVYGVKQKVSGALEFNKLEAKENIAAQSPFLIMLESETPRTSLSLPREGFKENVSIHDENLEENTGSLELMVKTRSEEENVHLSFTEDRNIKRIKDLNSYPSLYLPDQSYLNFSFKEGENYYNKLTFFTEMERQVELPIHFSSSEDGNFTFSIEEWAQIPSGWTITLVDHKTDKEYNLRRDFSVTIAHDFMEGVTSRTDDQGTFSKAQYREEDRFVLKIIPENASLKNGQEVNDLPREVELDQNYPNPFNPVTTISFYLPESEEVRLSVFNIVGQPVAVIVDGTLSVGQHQFEWDATDKPSGMYIYQLEVGSTVMTRKMTLVK